MRGLAWGIVVSGVAVLAASIFGPWEVVKAVVCLIVGALGATYVLTPWPWLR